MNLLANAIDAVNDIFPEALPTNVGAVSEEGLIDSNLSLVNPNKWIELDLSIQASTVVLSVTDCGSGISETTATKMFQPFFSTKEVGKGTGMGLAAAQGIALQHHGLLKYEKRNGHTCFVYTMPLAQEESVKSAFKSKAVVDPDSNAFSGRPGGGAAA
jgi:signal transduction histidine kinase